MHRPRKHEAVDEMSWRDTLFVWRGDVEYLDSIIVTGPGNQWAELWRGQPIKGSTFKHRTGPDFFWKGRWIGVDSADATKADMPPVRDWRDGANAFESDNNFNVRGDMVQYSPSAKGKGGDSVFIVKPNEAGHNALASPQEGRGWMLDNGDGHRWYGDTVHEIRWCGDDLVFARGYNEFAPFVSVGFLSGYRHRDVLRSPVSKSNRTLTVARRYLDDKDERCGWSMDDLEREVRAAAASSSPKHPWMVDCMGAARMKKRKR